MIAYILVSYFIITMIILFMNMVDDKKITRKDLIILLLAPVTLPGIILLYIYIILKKTN
jgi:hypothetical protein